MISVRVGHKNTTNTVIIRLFRHKMLIFITSLYIIKEDSK